MKKEEISLADIQRILLGEAPAEFLLEVLIRSLISYLVLLLVLRLMGKRMSGKLTHTEMAVMLMFGAVVSSAMQIPERGLVESSFVLFLILLFQRSVTLWTVRRRKVENIVFGKMSMLVKNGQIQLKALNDEIISRKQLFRVLRSKEIRHLGEVKRVYMETSGAFSIYKFKEAQPGLSIYPANDEGVNAFRGEDSENVACSICGTVYRKESRPQKCENCGSDSWEPAVQ